MAYNQKDYDIHDRPAKLRAIEFYKQYFNLNFVINPTEGKADLICTDEPGRFCEAEHASAKGWKGDPNHYPYGRPAVLLRKLKSKRFHHGDTDWLTFNYEYTYALYIPAETVTKYVHDEDSYVDIPLTDSDGEIQRGKRPTIPLSECHWQDLSNPIFEPVSVKKLKPEARQYPYVTDGGNTIHSAKQISGGNGFRVYELQTAWGIRHEIVQSQKGIFGAK